MIIKKSGKKKYPYKVFPTKGKSFWIPSQHNINDFNINTMILDELHPTMEAHCMIGKFIAGKIPYKVI